MAKYAIISNLIMTNQCITIDMSTKDTGPKRDRSNYTS